ncbi:MAG: methylamine methyltransferase corrinoid protein reductive activase [Methanomassiliicoccales archaeon]|nr:methylamine methyltransferase corrinoid protein reductive activase [Methanomassiliicoccales archaeon]NYT14957.1 methylamine methyltransferase corrinoid protein reductive activase [Methanomassiliicoccales archaeon]
MAYGIALDLGTSGYRTHLVDLNDHGKIISTAITMRHPLPGANVMDHLHFWIENGAEVGHSIVKETIDKLICLHEVDRNQISKIAVCGNPIQLSMFENIEIRDLAYAGQSILKRLKIERPSRKSHVITAGEIGLNMVRSETEVGIPPAIRHEVGADALAMIIKSKLLEKGETCMVTDYGTNAEMGLFHDGELYSGSAAAGPAMEGQHISHGMLAAPFAISDLDIDPDGRWKNMVLDDRLGVRVGSITDPRKGTMERVENIPARGITGTGVVAAVACGLESGLITLPSINTSDRAIHLQDGIKFLDSDLREAGKAMGAIRAGHRTLITEVGIEDKDIRTMYMAGASGTYVDPIKAQTTGLVPRVLEKTVQVGNTSLMMAYDILIKEDTLDMMQEVADSIASKHIMFATSKVFEDLYVNEIALWSEGMPFDAYNEMLKFSGLMPLPAQVRPKETLRMVDRDIPEVGDKGLKVLDYVGVYLVGEFGDCTGCKKCEKECPECALRVEEVGNKEFRIKVATDLCLGTACKHCERTCPKQALEFSDLKITRREYECN